MIGLAAIVIGVPFVILSAIWWYHEQTKKSGWIDVAWTVAVGTAGAWGAVAGHGEAIPERAWLYGAMAAAWGIRLAIHLAARTLKHPDDPRYAKMRHVWGKSAPVRMYGMLMVQAFAAAILALAITVAAHASDGPVQPVDMAAVALFAVAWIGETLADAQMRAFRADPGNKGKIMQSGLWAWSRHPNYFFEWLSWCAFAVGAFAGSPLAIVAALPAPVLMFHLLHNVSGVPMLEKYLRSTRGSEFDSYTRRVAKFFPRPPRPA